MEQLSLAATAESQEATSVTRFPLQEVPPPTPIFHNTKRNKRSTSTIITSADHYWKAWSMFKAVEYDSDSFSSVDEEEKKKVTLKYKGIEERFYTKTHLPVITPDNALDFLEHLKKLNIKEIDMQEHFQDQVL